MACVILPSETARLVYGYLVKENLNDIALQFLESSPYLMDCCQIVKSGYQFNTKLMGKDLQELLQEYSVIHNLVNNKVSLLCKTSLLYKRIKLKCESLPEILELILFWKYKNTKSEEPSSNSEKSEKNLNSHVVNTSCEYTNSSDVASNRISVNNDTCFNEKSDSNLVQKNDTIVPETFNSKLCCEPYPVNKEVDGDIRNNVQPAGENEINDVENDPNKGSAASFMQMQISEIPESLEINRNISSDNKMNTNNSDQTESKFNSSTNVLTIDINPHCENVVGNEIPGGSLTSSEEAARFENQIKIVGIQEENQNDPHSLGVFSKPLGEEDGNVDLGNSSVVFVGPDGSNVTINQERSQIIVIPIDYYKPQEDLQSNLAIGNNEKIELIQEKEIIAQEKNKIIFDGHTTNSAPLTATSLLFSDRISKSTTIDENIITEKDFYENRHLMYNLEKELNKPDPPPEIQPPQPVETASEDVSIQPASGPLILVSNCTSQTVSSRPQKYRTILPKEKQPIQIHPVVVVQPLLENNKDSSKIQPLPKVTRLPSKAIKRKADLGKKRRVKGPKKEENAGTIRENIVMNPIAIEVNSQEQDNQLLSSQELPKEVDAEGTNEEKENLEKVENKKTETPVFVTKRNSKRLSLSTPRRRSHIRALEFETPPKTNEEKKKSKTSPKVKVDQVNVERKSVRNTLFKSPIPENEFKSPVVSKGTKKAIPQPTPKPPEALEPLNELSIPIATRSPNTKLSDAWENLTGVGCVIGQNEPSKTSPPKKMWDADLRCFIPENNLEKVPLEKKRIRKPERNQKDNRKSTKKKVVSTKKIKPVPLTVSPSKISLTAKRNTYSINGNDEGSPIRTLIDDLKIVTPFKDIETVRPTEETPLTKLLRENINTIDIDLSMINTPSFPPTPSIVITPDLDDVSMPGTNYYSPIKDCSKEKVLKITDYFKIDPEKANKRETKEKQEKVIDDLVSKAKEIIGLGKDVREESAARWRPSGKILSMVKIQMLTQCDKKLCENIPINEETTFSNSFTSQTTLVENASAEGGTKTNLKGELEEKRRRALKKIKVVKENLSQTKNRVTQRGRKRKKSGNASRSDKSKSDVSTAGEKMSSESDESFKKDAGVLHSTPYPSEKAGKAEKTDSSKEVDHRLLADIRQKFPPFLNDANRFPQLNERSRKKLHYVENFLKLTEIANFINDFNEDNPPKLFLDSSLRRFFHVFYKWLKHPHKRELNASAEMKALLEEYLSAFDKISRSLSQRSKRFEESGSRSVGLTNSDVSENRSGNKHPLSDDEEGQWKAREKKKRKDEDTDDGVVSTLPLKKRKSTVQQVEIKTVLTTEKNDSKNTGAENVSQTQNFLQDIDVDRFLSQIHGQENR